MGLEDFWKLLEKAVDSLNNNDLSIRQKLYYARNYFLHIEQSYDEEISKKSNEFYSQEIVDLYVNIKSSLEDLEIDEKNDQEAPSIIIEEEKAWTVRSKIIALHNLIEIRLGEVDRLNDLYF